MHDKNEQHGAPALLRSVHTSNLPELFRSLRISLAVSTYQAGKVILVRADGETLNTHFRSFSKPMGIAYAASRLVIGDSNKIWNYCNVPAVASKLDPPERHDACFLPRRIHVTGDIDIHEMAYDCDNELWVVNTRFSCLCTLDAEHSFTPRWRPSFVSAYAPEDRCHLNGLALVAGRPRYVTALGEADTAGGWRASKRNGGLLMDLESNQILLRGLSMPHSPRWYQDKLWLLESGQGTLAIVDLERGTWRAVAELPGFTRGIDFYGPLAFIGLSQIRETATFSGLPLVERLRERNCGVWVVHINTGKTLGFLRFEAGVQEIFSVQVLPGIAFPEILEWEDERLAHSYVLPDAALAQVFLPGDEELRRSPAYHFRQGMEHYRKGRLTEAIAALRECARLDPVFPDARYNLGVALGDAGGLNEAFDTMTAAAEMEPERAEAWNSLGYLACALKSPRKAVSYYEHAIKLKPDYALAHFNLGITLLQLGDYMRGLGEYEWRWKTGQFTPFNCPYPRWDDSPIPAQVLLIHTEQGAGDAIQFVRYLPLAVERVGKLILVCTPHLAPLFATLSGIAEIREPGDFRLTEFDTWLPLLSLPYVFGGTLETIPNRTPYFNMALLKRRKTRDVSLRSAETGVKNIGLVWAGSPTHQNDRHRSCPLSEFHPLLRLPGITWYSLQKGERTRDLAQLPADCPIQDLDDLIHDYGDTALLLDQLDLLISVDTSVAHLAGAWANRCGCYCPKSRIGAGDWRGKQRLVPLHALVPANSARGLGGGAGASEGGVADPVISRYLETTGLSKSGFAFA